MMGKSFIIVRKRKKARLDLVGILWCWKSSERNEQGRRGGEEHKTPFHRSVCMRFSGSRFGGRRFFLQEFLCALLGVIGLLISLEFVYFLFLPLHSLSVSLSLSYGCGLLSICLFPHYSFSVSSFSLCTCSSLFLFFFFVIRMTMTIMVQWCFHFVILIEDIVVMRKWDGWKLWKGVGGKFYFNSYDLGRRRVEQLRGHEEE